MRALYKSALLVGGLLLGSMAFAQKTQLLVYTALEVDQLKAYQEGFRDRKSTRLNSSHSS